MNIQITTRADEDLQDWYDRGVTASGEDQSTATPSSEKK